MNATARATLIAAFILVGSFATNAGAVQPDEMLPDPVLEARARDISEDLRCLVCQNQSIDDSNADLARDLRVIVRQRLVAGDSDNQVVEYVVARYGDYVLLNPPKKGITYLLWYGPAGLFLIAALALFVAARRGRLRAEPAPALSADEKKRVSELLGGGPGS